MTKLFSAFHNINNTSTMYKLCVFDSSHWNGHKRQSTHSLSVLLTAHHGPSWVLNSGSEQCPSQISLVRRAFGNFLTTVGNRLKVKLGLQVDRGKENVLFQAFNDRYKATGTCRWPSASTSWDSWDSNRDRSKHKGIESMSARKEGKLIIFAIRNTQNVAYI